MSHQYIWAVYNSGRNSGQSFWQGSIDRDTLLMNLKSWAKTPGSIMDRDEANPAKLWIHNVQPGLDISWVLVMPSPLSAEILFRIWSEEKAK